MPVRTNTRTVTFTKPFMLKGREEALPPGSYEVETDEELLEGISFPAYRRVRTLMHLLPSSANPGMRQTVKIDPADLEAALKRDGTAQSTGITTGSALRRLETIQLDADRRAIDGGENEGMPSLAP